jgi:uncharacterized C2H2 Zn-finger protein
MFECIKCNSVYQTKAAKTNHEKFCGLPKKRSTEINRNCPKCNMIIYASYENHVKSCDGFGPRRRTRKEKLKRSGTKGITFDELYGKEKSLEIRLKLSKSMIDKKIWENKTHTQETKNIISARMKLNPNSGGIRKGSGRGKSGWYKGNWCDSTWELAWVIYNIENSINFKRNNTGFEYIYNGETKKYYPDFIIDDEYYEIKGRRNYESLDDKNKAKIDSFNYGVLNVLYSKEIKPYIDYATSKYGKNFYALYE